MYCDTRSDVLMIEIFTVSTAYIQYMYLTRILTRSICISLFSVIPTHRKKNNNSILIVVMIGRINDFTTINLIHITPVLELP